MARSVVTKILVGCFLVISLILGGYYWVQNHWNSNYIAAKCEQRVKARCSPVLLQSWAANLIAHAQEFTNSPIPVPRQLEGIWEHRPSVYIREARADSEAYVYVFWGSGGLGHWGMSVGSAKFVPASWDTQGVEWQPGIYFWRDCH
jgi:hypothetical protein